MAVNPSNSMSQVIQRNPVEHTYMKATRMRDGSVKNYSCKYYYTPRTDRPRLSEDDKHNIRALYKFGLPKTKISERYDIGPARLNNILKK